MQLQVGVKAFIRNDKGQYLFLRRAAPMADGKSGRWDIPGGRIAVDESLGTGLAREVREEAGLQLNQSLQLVDAQDIFVSQASLHVVRLTYVATASGVVRLSRDHDEYQWISLAVARHLNIDDYLRQTIKLLANPES